MDKYFWTEHAKYKMKQYGLSEQRVKRVIRAPFRIEEGIVKNTVAVMVPAGNFKPSKEGEKPSWKQELWVMYQIAKPKQGGKFKIISTWRYPGVSPRNNPIPQDILGEISRLVRSGGF